MLAMLLTRIIVLVVIMTTAAVSSHRGDEGASSQTDAVPVLRLERLEKLMEQFQSDWRKEKLVLTEKIQRSQTVTDGLTEALTRTQAENKRLKDRMDELQRELASVKQHQQHSVKVESSMKDGPEPYPAQNSHLWDGVNSTSPLVLTSRSNDHNVLTSRSDDYGSLGVEVSRLAQTVTGLTADVQALQNSNTQLQHGMGSSFVQWGSSTCSGDGSAQLVYSGVMGGSYHNHVGSASNPLCLTMEPSLQDVKAGTTYTLIYGAEYETADSHQNEDPVCAVCRMPLHTTTIMVAGTDVCTAGWTKQYSGFLMGGYYNTQGGSQFICVDSKMESEVGGHGDFNGHLLYFTKTRCGSLPCPPYHDNKVMTCVVCSK